MLFTQLTCAVAKCRDFISVAIVPATKAKEIYKLDNVLFGEEV